VLQDRLQRDQQHACSEDATEHHQRAAVCNPDLRRLDAREPVHDATEHREEQRLERADHRGAERHREDVGTQSLGARPQERKETLRQRDGRGLRIRRYELF